MRVAFRWALPAALCCLLLVPAGAFGGATWKNGVYKGKFSDGSSIQFVGANHSIKGLATSFVRMPCSDGTAIRARATGFGGFISVPLNSNGLFNALSSSKHINITGTLSGRKASGTAHYLAHLNESRQFDDPNGPITCDSGPLTWSAKHPVKKKKKK
jgi:hypothetical protein